MNNNSKRIAWQIFFTEGEPGERMCRNLRMSGQQSVANWSGRTKEKVQKLKLTVTALRRSAKLQMQHSLEQSWQFAHGNHVSCLTEISV